MADRSVSESDEQIPLPSEWTRTIISLLVIIHLFAICIAILTGNDNGNSTLLTNIKTRAPGIEPYLWQMWLDHGYGYDYISFMPMYEDTSSMDWPYHLKATIDYGPGRTPEVIELPADGMEPSDRRQRWQQLPKALAAFSQWQEGPQISDVLTDRRHEIGGSIGAGLLREHPGSKFVTLNWYYHRGKIAPESRMADLPEWTPTDPRYFVPVGTMRVELLDDKPQSMDILPVGEVSPLKPRTSATSSKSASSAADSAAKKAGAK